MYQAGLVLEGGGMRGSYTAGVLQYMMEHDLYLPYVIGVSAGACNGSSYISRQIERNRIVNIEYASHPEYLSFRNYLTKRQLFGMDFIFDRLPNELVPFDFDAFKQAKERFVVGTTDCITGEPVYFEKTGYENRDLMAILRATSSLPFIAPEVEFDGKLLLDGGISDPIPLRKSEQDGNKKNVVILTRNAGYVKSKPSFTWAVKRKYPQFEGLVKSIMNRYQVYNETIAYLEEQEAKGKVFIIRPQRKIEVSRIERNPQKLSVLYQQGYEEAKAQGEELLQFLRS